jgi:hypothetical protein
MILLSIFMFIIPSAIHPCKKNISGKTIKKDAPSIQKGIP